ncbi:Rv3235 family protein [Streptomyces sp. NPDC047123]|uniref:Rv3235 family protein n=1 Tax=Streptomyces sp. NPDC047123 TaxID=3155622 RepID=UPI0033FDD47D
MPRPRPAATRPPAGRPPHRRDSRRPAERRPTTIPAQPPPHPTELFAERLVLVLSGQRPMHWVARHVAHTAFDELARLAELRPLCAGGHRPAIHRIGHYQPHPEAYEVFVRIAAGPRLHALAFRLTRGADRRWRCTAVETDPARSARVPEPRRPAPDTPKGPDTSPAPPEMT